MGVIPISKLALVKKLYYQEKLPMKMVAEKLGVTLDAVVYFMRKQNLVRRTISEDSVIRFNNKLPSFTLATRLTERQKMLKIIGVTLYWGEGYKTEKSNGVDLANSDVFIILSFLSFLREVCGINESRLRVLLYCHENQNQEDLIKYWSKKTKIPKSQFTKPYVRKITEYGTIRTMPYGLVHIRYADKKLLFVIKKWIEEYKVL